MKHSVSIVPGSYDRVMSFIGKNERLCRELGKAEYSPDQIDGNGDPYDLLQFGGESEISEELEYLLLNLDEAIVTTFNIEEREDGLRAALGAFVESSEFPEALAKATRKSWEGGGYSVELFSDGRWRVLDNMEIGNRYESPGEILGLPTLDDDDYQQCVVEGDMTEEEYFLSVFQNDEEDLKQGLRDKLAGVA